ncbi:MAG: tetratricopeptide repeat protein [Sphingobacteriales bacterium]|nr:tetratricopeptide repeat protein [Sphingobacteriales bacterium]
MKISHYIEILLLIFFPLSIYSQSDNIELQKMYDEDQSSRMVKDINWTILTKQDKERENRVYELIKTGQIVTGKDYYNSAMIFQHGEDSIAYGMAVKHMRKAIELDSTINRWLLAAAIDRDLLSRNKPQIYGTQYSKTNGEEWKRSKMDTTQVTDKERKFYNVETLSEQIEKVRIMNLIPISEFYTKSKTISQTIKFIKSEHKKGKKSKYNISENGLNNFGYELINSDKENEALEIFTLNTILNPNGYNTFDSLGECLLLLGKKEEGIKAYKKSLELNPNNENAKKIINGY